MAYMGTRADEYNRLHEAHPDWSHGKILSNMEAWNLYAHECEMDQEQAVAMFLKVGDTFYRYGATITLKQSMHIRTHPQHLLGIRTL